jgi:hypothetical protein
LALANRLRLGKNRPAPASADPDQFQVGPFLSPKADRLLFAQR